MNKAEKFIIGYMKNNPYEDFMKVFNAIRKKCNNPDKIPVEYLMAMDKHCKELEKEFYKA